MMVDFPAYLFTHLAAFSCSLHTRCAGVNEVWSAWCYGTLKTQGLGAISPLQTATPAFSLNGPLNTFTSKAFWGKNSAGAQTPSHYPV